MTSGGKEINQFPLIFLVLDAKFSDDAWDIWR